MLFSPFNSVFFWKVRSVLVRKDRSGKFGWSGPVLKDLNFIGLLLHYTLYYVCITHKIFFTWMCLVANPNSFFSSLFSFDPSWFCNFIELEFVTHPTNKNFDEKHERTQLKPCHHALSRESMKNLIKYFYNLQKNILVWFSTPIHIHMYQLFISQVVTNILEKVF